MLLDEAEKKRSAEGTSLKHSNLLSEAPGNTQTPPRLLVTAQMDLLSCPCLSHRVHMFLSAGDMAFCKSTPVPWRDKQQSRWDRTTPIRPCGLFEIRKSVLKKHSKHLPADRLCTLVQCKASSFFWEPVHESVMNRFDSKGALKKRSYFWFRWGIKKVL